MIDCCDNTFSGNFTIIIFPRFLKNTSCKIFPVNLLYFPFFRRRSFLSKRTVNNSQSRTCTIKVVKQVEIFSFYTYPPPLATQVVVLKSRLVQN